MKQNVNIKCKQKVHECYISRVKILFSYISLENTTYWKYALYLTNIFGRLLGKIS